MASCSHARGTASACALETDGELAAQVGRQIAEAHADVARKLDALPDDWRSYFAKRLAAVSTTAAT